MWVRIPVREADLWFIAAELLPAAVCQDLLQLPGPDPGTPAAAAQVTAAAVHHPRPLPAAAAQATAAAALRPLPIRAAAEVTPEAGPAAAVPMAEEVEATAAVAAAVTAVEAVEAVAEGSLFI